MDAVSEEAKCERLEEIGIDGDPEKVFKSKLSCLPGRRKNY